MADFFVEIHKLILKFIWTLQGTQNRQRNLEKEQSRKAHTSCFQNLPRSNSN